MKQLTQRIGELLLQNHWHIGTAESCTGGLLAATITEVAGSSAWFDEGVVTYANASKERLLGVGHNALDEYGAVSQPVVEAMAKGVIENGADVALATSGIAGPDGGTTDKPVGTVWMAWGVAGQIESEVRCFEGDRQTVRLAASEYLLRRLLERLEQL